ncbi:MAG TPA: glycoside hydrolase domain-containing protein [Terriglobia bacterium]|nr:glycoside hydrolase domain-containing protein [Terriglobia bacterium]
MPRKRMNEGPGKKRETSWETLLSRRDFAKLTLGAIGVAEAGRQSLARGAQRTATAGSKEIQEVRYGIGPCWPRELGDVRAELRVSDKADAVWAHIPWRRRDRKPQNKAVVLVDGKTGKPIKNLARITTNREFGDLVFQPATAPGNYFLYYLPYQADTAPAAYSITYPSPEVTADPAWLARHQRAAGSSGESSWKTLPQAKVLEIQARSDFDRFDPMEVIATEEETRNLLAQHPGRTYLTFPEERQFPIRMSGDLPLRWIDRGPTVEFHGAACRGEFYVFQIGIYAYGAGIPNLSVRYGDLESARGRRIPRAAMRCFNLAGTDWAGRPITKTFPVPLGIVRPLWFGIQIPKDAAAGSYDGTLVLHPEGAEETSIRLHLDVSRQGLEDAGDNDLWRQARLRWLDSTIAIDDEVTRPYTALKTQEQTVSCLGREVRFAASGFPESIRSHGLEILAKPARLAVETAEGEVHWSGGRTDILGSGPGSLTRQTVMSAGKLSLVCWARMEFDGHINYRVKLTAHSRTPVKDIRLELPLRKEIATYMMGLGRKGGYRPKAWKWVWDINRANNMVWVGEVGAGLQCKLKGQKETWDMYDLKTEGVPDSWGNSGKGGCTVAEEDDQVVVRAYSGERILEPGAELVFAFGLLVTPVKPLNPDHWTERYYQQGYPEPGAVPVEKLLRSGATIVNIHQGNELNPYINYPFLTVDKLASYVNGVHAAGLKAKIYYTVRELSNRVVEMWALRSLGEEVFADGPGGGGSWLREHLVSHYKPGWHQSLPDGEVDEAILQTGLSRWHNYYLEGLAYLLRRAAIDGLYLDGIGYDREVMKRVRKVLDRNRQGSLIDFHSGNEFPFHDLRISPANKYMEHFPYIDSLWFGEGYNYNESPDYWLVEISGLPFGLFSDMLQDGGNPWRGMIYGMTTRYFDKYDPSHIWKLWNNFKIQEAEMIGYWVPSCPVKTGCKDVLATVYKKKGSALISLASWSKDPVSVSLNIDWAALGQDAETSKLTAPPIPGFQKAASFSPAEKIPVEPGRGWLLILQ